MAVRVARVSDVEAMQAIYAPIVRDTAISFEAEPPTVAEMGGRVVETLKSHPWLVFDSDGIAGYAYAARHQERAAYRWSVNVTVYVAENQRGRGVGKALYAELFDILRRQGFQSAFAGITLPNPGSVALHEAMAFEPLGVYRDVGFKLGAWRDVGWWRLSLNDAGAQPAEPIPFGRMA